MGSTIAAATVVGVLFLTATASYLAGSELIASAVEAPDHLSNLNATRVRLGVLLELVNAAAVVGIGVLLFPVLRRHREAMALGYAGTRIIESTLLLVPRVLPVLGFFGYAALFASGWLVITGHDATSVLYIPGALFELALPLWLIARGFNSAATTRPAGER